MGCVVARTLLAGEKPVVETIDDGAGDSREIVVVRDSAVRCVVDEGNVWASGSAQWADTHMSVVFVRARDGGLVMVVGRSPWLAEHVPDMGARRVLFDRECKATREDCMFDGHVGVLRDGSVMVVCDMEELIDEEGGMAGGFAWNQGARFDVHPNVGDEFENPFGMLWFVLTTVIFLGMMSGMTAERLRGWAVGARGAADAALHRVEQGVVHGVVGNLEAHIFNAVGATAEGAQKALAVLDLILCFVMLISTSKRSAAIAAIALWTRSVSHARVGVTIPMRTGMAIILYSIWEFMNVKRQQQFIFVVPNVNQVVVPNAADDVELLDVAVGAAEVVGGDPAKVAFAVRAARGDKRVTEGLSGFQKLLEKLLVAAKISTAVYAVAKMCTLAGDVVAAYQRAQAETEVTALIREADELVKRCSTVGNELDAENYVAARHLVEKFVLFNRVRNSTTLMAAESRVRSVMDRLSTLLDERAVAPGAFVVYCYGPAGVGKSVFAKTILPLMMALMEPNQPVNPARVYKMQLGDKFFDDFPGTPFVFCDDCLVNLASPENGLEKTEMLLNMMTDKFHLPAAALTWKMVLVTAFKGMVIVANDRDFQGMAHLDPKIQTALRRRIHLTFEVNVVEGVVKNETFDHLNFRLRDYGKRHGGSDWQGDEFPNGDMRAVEVYRLIADQIIRKLRADVPGVEKRLERRVTGAAADVLRNLGLDHGLLHWQQPVVVVANTRDEPGEGSSVRPRELNPPMEQVEDVQVPPGPGIPVRRGIWRYVSMAPLTSALNWGVSNRVEDGVRNIGVQCAKAMAILATIGAVCYAVAKAMEAVNDETSIDDTTEIVPQSGPTRVGNRKISRLGRIVVPNTSDEFAEPLPVEKPDERVTNLQSKLVRLTLYHSKQVKRTVLAVPVRGDLLTTSHFADAFDLVDIQMLTVEYGTTIRKLMWEDVGDKISVRSLPGYRDLSLFTLPKLPGLTFADLSKYITTGYKIMEKEWCDLIGLTWVERICVTDTLVSYGGSMSDAPQSLKCLGYATTRAISGTCGAPIVNVHGFIVGIHVAGTASNGFGAGARVSSEDLVELLSEDFAVVAREPVPLLTEAITNPGYELCLHIHPARVPVHRIVTKSRLIENPRLKSLFDSFDYVHKVVPEGSWTNEGDVLMHPVLNALDIAAVAATRAEPYADQTREAMGLMGEWFASAVPVQDVRILTFAEVCDQLTMSSSTGSTSTGTRKKGDVLKKVDGVWRWEDQQLEQEFNAMVEAGKEGKNLFATTSMANLVSQPIVKDEKLRPGKRKRIVFAGALLLSMYCKMFFGCFSERIAFIPPEGVWGVGTNPVMHWSSYGTRYHGRKVWSWDYPKYDLQIKASSKQGIQDFFEAVRMRHTMSEKHWNGLLAMAKLLGVTLVGVDGLVLLFLVMWSSGLDCTSFWDGNFNVSDIIVAVSLAMGITVKAAYIKVRAARPLVYGDDVLLGDIEGLDPRKFMDAMKELGWELTSATDKTRKGIDVTNIEEATYIGRGFVYEPEVERWLCPLRRDSLLNVMAFRHTNLTEVEHFRAVMIPTLYEAAMHDEKFFSGVVDGLVTGCNRLSIEVPEQLGWTRIRLLRDLGAEPDGKLLEGDAVIPRGREGIMVVPNTKDEVDRLAYAKAQFRVNRARTDARERTQKVAAGNSGPVTETSMGGAAKPRLNIGRIARRIGHAAVRAMPQPYSAILTSLGLQHPVMDWTGDANGLPPITDPSGPDFARSLATQGDGLSAGVGVSYEMSVKEMGSRFHPVLGINSGYNATVGAYVFQELPLHPCQTWSDGVGSGKSLIVPHPGWAVSGMFVKHWMCKCARVRVTVVSPGQQTGKFIVAFVAGSGDNSAYDFTSVASSPVSTYTAVMDTAVSNVLEMEIPNCNVTQLKRCQMMTSGSNVFTEPLGTDIDALMGTLTMQVLTPQRAITTGTTIYVLVEYAFDDLVFFGTDNISPNALGLTFTPQTGDQTIDPSKDSADVDDCEFHVDMATAYDEFPEGTPLLSESALNPVLLQNVTMTSTIGRVGAAMVLPASIINATPNQVKLNNALWLASGYQIDVHASAGTGTGGLLYLVAVPLGLMYGSSLSNVLWSVAAVTGFPHVRMLIGAERTWTMKLPRIGTRAGYQLTTTNTGLPPNRLVEGYVLVLWTPTAGLNCTGVTPGVDISIYGRLLNPRVVVPMPSNFIPQAGEEPADGVVSEDVVKTEVALVQETYVAVDNGEGMVTTALDYMHKPWYVISDGARVAGIAWTAVGEGIFTCTTTCIAPWLPQRCIGVTNPVYLLVEPQPQDVILACFALVRGAMTQDDIVSSPPFLASAQFNAVGRPTTSRVAVLSGYAPIHLNSVFGPNDFVDSTSASLTSFDAAVVGDTMFTGGTNYNQMVGCVELVRGSGMCDPRDVDNPNAPYFTTPTGIDVNRSVPVRVPRGGPDVFYFNRPPGIIQGNGTVDLWQNSVAWCTKFATSISAASAETNAAIRVPAHTVRYQACDDWRMCAYRPPLGLCVNSSGPGTLQTTWSTTRYVNAVQSNLYVYDQPFKFFDNP